MRKARLLCFLLLLALPGLSALGQRLTKGVESAWPEPLTGVWEMPVPGGAVGLSIQASSLVQGQPRNFAGVRQQVGSILFGIYKRSGRELRLGDMGWYSDDSAGVRWSDNRLVIPLGRAGEPAVSASLTFDSKHQVWQGQLQRGEFSGPVVLRRAGKIDVRPGHGFTGTWWAQQDSASGQCLHLSEQQDGALTAWIDSFLLTGRLRYAPGIHPLPTTPWQYGDVAAATRSGPSVVNINFGPFAAACCPISFAGRLSGDGQTIRGGIESGPLIWQRVHGESCRAPRHRPSS